MATTATIFSTIDRSWIGQTMTLVATQGGSVIATASASLSLVATTMVQATIAIELPSGAAGEVTLTMIDSAGNQAWLDKVMIDSNGNIIPNFADVRLVKGIDPTLISSIGQDVLDAMMANPPDVNVVSFGNTVLNSLSQSLINAVSGGGDHLVTVRVLSDDAALISNAPISVLDINGDPVDGMRGRTNSLGVTRFYLNAGDYQLQVLSIAGFDQPDPIAITVDGEESIDITIDRIVYPSSTDPATCLCYLHLIGDQGEVIDNATASVRVAERTRFVDGRLVVTDTGEFEGVDGILEMELLRGVAYRVQVIAGPWIRSFVLRVPDAASLLITEAAVDIN